MTCSSFPKWLESPSSEASCSCKVVQRLCVSATIIGPTQGEAVLHQANTLKKSGTFLLILYEL